MNIASFDDLLQAARHQPEPQRLLFVFAAASVREDASPVQKALHASGTGGELTPVLCVDKRPDELADFSALVEESRATGKDWHVVFVGAMGDRPTPLAGTDPMVDDALRHIMQMIRYGTTGSLLAFDRRGDPLVFGPGGAADA